MNRRIKVLLSLLAVAAGFSFGMQAFAQYSTQAVTLADTVAETQNLTVIQDQSDYPTQNDRHGTIVRWYSFAADGGAAGSISLEHGKVYEAVPDNTVVLDGYIQVITPVLPATGTNSLGINTATDILAATTNLSVAGFLDIVPQSTAATLVQATNDMPFVFTRTGAAATQGVFMVVLDVYMGQ